jgi:hypothetical protein
MRRGVNESSKVRRLNTGVKSNELNAPKAQIMASPNYGKLCLTKQNQVRTKISLRKCAQPTTMSSMSLPSNKGKVAQVQDVAADKHDAAEADMVDGEADKEKAEGT